MGILDSIRFRRSISVAIPLFDAAVFSGWFKDFLDPSINVAQTGVTVGWIFVGLNLFLLFLIVKHKVP